jgi:hypothetical protein
MSQAAPTDRATQLAAIQRWLQSVIMHPQGVTAGLESDAARESIDLPAASVAEVIAPSEALTSVERLAIYSRAYTARLLECLSAAYPTLAHAVGTETFEALAQGYLQAHPSHSYTLDKLGTHFADFLERTRPDRDARDPEDGTVGWPDFLIDLARFDWAIGQVFDGPGAEHLAPWSAEDLSQISPERWPDLRLIPNPSLWVLNFRYPVNVFFSAVRAGESPRLPEPATTYLALVRRDFIVQRHELSQRQYDVLRALVDGHTLGQAIERAAAEADLTRLTSELYDWFGYWTANDFFLGAG